MRENGISDIQYTICKTDYELVCKMPQNVKESK